MLNACDDVQYVSVNLNLCVVVVYALVDEEARANRYYFCHQLK